MRPVLYPLARVCSRLVRSLMPSRYVPRLSDYLSLSSASHCSLKLPNKFVLVGWLGVGLVGCLCVAVDAAVAVGVAGCLSVDPFCRLTVC